MELVQHPTLADSICDIRSRKIKRTFFTQINTLIDGRPIIIFLKQQLMSLFLKKSIDN